MKYHISIKFLAIVLAAVLLAVAAGSGLGIFVLLENELYEHSVEELYEDTLENWSRTLAVDLAHRYASLHLGNLPESYLTSYYHYWSIGQFREGYYFYTIRDAGGSVLESTYNSNAQNASSFEITVTDLNYRVLLSCKTAESTSWEYENTDPIWYGYGTETDPGESDLGVVYTDVYYDYETETTQVLTYMLAEMDSCTVTVYLLDGAMERESWWEPLELLYGLRLDLFWILALSLLLFAVCAVYLCCSAGRKPGGDAVRAGGLNRLPLDIWLACGGLAEVLLALLFGETLGLLSKDISLIVFLWCGGLIAVAACLVFVGFCFAFVAQIKMKDHFWWNNSLIGRVCRKIGQGIRWCIRGCKRLLEMLPDLWQLVVIAAGLGFVLFVTFCFAYGNSYIRVNRFFAMILFLEVCAVLAFVGYCFYAFGVLKKGAQIMAQGNLHDLVPTKHLLGPFKIFGWQLNRLSGAARRAAEEQMKSERMKTELITNVSHDIKTPLTSIINYVDLLEKPHTDAENAEYLEVLSRQSQRLKKLIEDLMEMSKASTGAMAVEVTRLDAGESLRQAVGEFADKLASAGLTPVVTMPEEPAYVLADGRHVWRVLSNLLGNAVKYALPGTRIYIDLVATGETVVMALKNISREELNLPADELAERFVRGDASRNTEGSGLGLNIARSLMELQKGRLDITVDGDLFKVTLQFPAAE